LKLYFKDVFYQRRRAASEVLSVMKWPGLCPSAIMKTIGFFAFMGLGMISLKLLVLRSKWQKMG
jgi:hypothetical protein